MPALIFPTACAPACAITEKSGGRLPLVYELALLFPCLLQPASGQTMENGILQPRTTGKNVAGQQNANGKIAAT